MPLQQFRGCALRLSCALLLPLCLASAATDVRVSFTLNSTDAYGAPVQESRYYYVYRPDTLSRSAPAPMILVMEASPNSGPARFLNRKADQSGFIVVSCSFSGNSSGTPGTGWNNHNPRINGWDDFDYITEVITRLRAAENADEAFIVGLSKGGHTSLAYACERPSMIRAASSVDEFMGLTVNFPTAPVPILVFQGTADTNVPYTMVKDSVDAWRAVNRLMDAAPVTTFEPSPLLPGRVSQAAWRGGAGGTQVAFVTIIGGTHTYATPSIQTGYDFSDTLWAFFSQFLTSRQDAPKIVSHPVNNVQISGQPASFWVVATGSGPLRYQWQRNGADIPGATANWYTTPPAAAPDDGAEFRAVVTNDAGSATSGAARLTVRAAPAGPAITTHPADQVVIAGQPVSFQVEAAGNGPLSYQWKKNGVEIAGATGDMLALPAAGTADSGASFTVVVTGASGSVTSNRATLTAMRAAGAPVILASPDRVRVLENRKAIFSVNAWSATPLSYQWQKGTGTGNMADIAGANEATYTTPLTTLADHLTLFRCVISNAAGSVTSASEMLAVTKEPSAPTNMTRPLSASAQTGVPFRYTIGSSGGTEPISYSASPLPDGLSLDAATGEISGTPASAGVTAISIEARNSAGRVSAVVTLTVTDTAPAQSIDAWRTANFGASATDPAIAGDDADPDGDGHTNLEEYQAGSDPLDAASVPADAAPASLRHRLSVVPSLTASRPAR